MGPTRVFQARHVAPDSIRGSFGLTDTRNTTHGSGESASPALGHSEGGCFPLVVRPYEGVESQVSRHELSSLQTFLALCGRLGKCGPRTEGQQD